jgi:hypothetical protein
MNKEGVMITARVWFKNPNGKNSMTFQAALLAVGINRRYDAYDPCQRDHDAYSDRFDHRYVFWAEDTTWESQMNMRTFLLLAKKCKGYIEVSIADLDFMHLGKYIGSHPLDPKDAIRATHEQALIAAGLNWILDD